MSRAKGTPNTPQSIIDEIAKKHRQWISRRQLAEEYRKPYKTIRNMCTRENNKQRKRSAGVPAKIPERRAAISLQEYKYENKRLKMENELLWDFLHAAGRK